MLWRGKNSNSQDGSSPRHPAISLVSNWWVTWHDSLVGILKLRLKLQIKQNFGGWRLKAYVFLLCFQPSRTDKINWFPNPYVYLQTNSHFSYLIFTKVITTNFKHCFDLCSNIKETPTHDTHKLGRTSSHQRSKDIICKYNH